MTEMPFMLWKRLELKQRAEPLVPGHSLLLTLPPEVPSV